MKIGFPLQNNSIQKMANGFHGCHLVGLFNISTEKVQQYTITELENNYGTMNLSDIFSDMGVEVVICNEIQPMALKFFNSNKITVYKSENDQIDSNIELMKEGRLKQYQLNMIQQKGCNSKCGSCSSGTCN